MKRPIYLLWSLTILTAGGVRVAAQDSMDSEFGMPIVTTGLLPSDETNLTEIVKGRVGYSGIAVDVLKTDNLLQLVNPFAPERYGSAEDNTLRDSFTGRAVGLKFLSIRF